MSFKNFFQNMTPAERAKFAERAHCNPDFLRQVATGTGTSPRKIELGLADVLVALGHGEFTLADLPLTDNALRQHLIRSSSVKREASDTAPTAAAHPGRRSTDKRGGPDNRSERRNG